MMVNKSECIYGFPTGLNITSHALVILTDPAKYTVRVDIRSSNPDISPHRILHIVQYVSLYPSELLEINASEKILNSHFLHNFFLKKNKKPHSCIVR